MQEFHPKKKSHLPQPNGPMLGTCRNGGCKGPTTPESLRIYEAHVPRVVKPRDQKPPGFFVVVR